MGYACPVCSDPQADAGHLANHLAFTAMLGDGDHEAWLDEHVPAWAEAGEAELADAVADLVEETEFPQLFEDTAGGLEGNSADPPEERSGALFDDAGHEHGRGAGHDHDHDHGSGGRDPSRGGAVDTSGPMDDEAAAVLEEAREMTRRMHGEEAPTDGDGSDAEGGTDTDAGGGDDAGR